MLYCTRICECWEKCVCDTLIFDRVYPNSSCFEWFSVDRSHFSSFLELSFSRLLFSDVVLSLTGRCFHQLLTCVSLHSLNISLGASCSLNSATMQIFYAIDLIFHSIFQYICCRLILFIQQRRLCFSVSSFDSFLSPFTHSSDGSSLSLFLCRRTVHIRIHIINYLYELEIIFCTICDITQSREQHWNSLRCHAVSLWVWVVVCVQFTMWYARLRKGANKQTIKQLLLLQHHSTKESDSEYEEE